MWTLYVSVRAFSDAPLLVIINITFNPPLQYKLDNDNHSCGEFFFRIFINYRCHLHHTINLVYVYIDRKTNKNWTLSQSSSGLTFSIKRFNFRENKEFCYGSITKELTQTERRRVLTVPNATERGVKETCFGYP